MIPEFDWFWWMAGVLYGLLMGIYIMWRYRE